VNITFPRQGEPVDRQCIFCGRHPRAGETYGTHEDGWDHTGICPECWNNTCGEDEEEEE
jgi:hypothetical protein